MKQPSIALWHVRILISVVFIFNLQCALVFLLNPERFASAYELSGIPGNLVVQGFGILFMMWNVPYLFAILQPIRNFTSLMEACLMQIIAGSGESLLYLRLDETHTTIKESLERFMIFDWSGVLLLGLALLLVIRARTRLAGVPVSV